MEKSYYGLLRGRVLPMEISAMTLLKDSNDSIFLLETKQMSGYTTKETMVRMIRREMEAEPKNPELEPLLEELGRLTYSSGQAAASRELREGMPLLQWLGIE